MGLLSRRTSQLLVAATLALVAPLGDAFVVSRSGGGGVARSGRRGGARVALRAPPRRGAAGDETAELLEAAEKLRSEAAREEAALRDLRDERQQRDDDDATARKQAKKTKRAGPPLLRIVLPMSKPDWTVVEELVEFKPFLTRGGAAAPDADGGDGADADADDEAASELVRFEVPVPMGLLLEEGEIVGSVVVLEVAPDSAAAAAGLRAGDLLRATSAVRQQMEMPTWSLLGGGIGRPRSFRFIYGADLAGPPPRQFEEVLAALASNRDDPERRPATLVVERAVDAA